MSQSTMSTLNSLRTVKTWHTEHVSSGGAVFPTYSSLQWFIRIHRDRLLQSGEFFPGRGGRISLIGPGFDSAVLAIIRDSSRASSTPQDCFEPETRPAHEGISHVG